MCAGKYPHYNSLDNVAHAVIVSPEGAWQSIKRDCFVVSLLAMTKQKVMTISSKYNRQLLIKHRIIAFVIFFATVSILKFSPLFAEPSLSYNFLLNPFKVLIAHADNGGDSGGSSGSDSGGSDGGDSSGSSGADSGGSSGADSGGSSDADSGGSSTGGDTDGSTSGDGDGGSPPSPPVPLVPPVPPIVPPVPPVPPAGPPLGPPPPPGGGGGGCCGTPILTLFSNKLPPFTDVTLASYVYLSQLPYTGMNNLDTIFYFAILFSISGVGAYKLTRRNRQKYE